MTPAMRVFSGLLLGAITGLLLAHYSPDMAATATAIAKPVGKLWLSALQMTIVPLVVALLIVGVNTATDAASSGRVARRAILWILALLLVAATYAALVAPLMLAFVPGNDELAATLRASTAATPTTTVGIGDWIGNIVPTNAIAAAAAGAIVPLVVFTLCFAFALTQIEAARRQLIVDLAKAVSETMIVIVHWVLALGPIGVFALILPVTTEAGAGVLGALGAYIAMQCLLYLGITLALYGVVSFGKGESLRRFASAILPAQVVAASTQSSLATLPAMVEVTTKSLQYPTQVTALVLPMAVTLFRITSPIQYLGVVSFISWSYGIDLSAAQITTAVLLAVVISIGSVGLPGQASFMGTNLPVTQAVGLPIEPLGILLAVDLVPDIFATLGNVTAQLTVTSRVARAEAID